MRRSDCPISSALDHIGDRWSLLVIRDIALYGKRSFSELLDSDEHMATNILSDRLARLETSGLLSQAPNPADRRKKIYRLTERGKDLLPVLIEMILWSVKYDPTLAVPPEFLEQAKRDRAALIAFLRSRIDALDGTAPAPRVTSDPDATPGISSHV